MLRLYLVRRNLDTYLGPFTLEGLQESYRRMEFGLEDEVCTSCNVWIRFDDHKNLERKYPEVAKVIQKELKGAWGISQPPVKRFSRHEVSKGDKQKQRSKVSQKKRKKWSSFGLGLSFATLLLLAMAGLTYWKQPTLIKRFLKLDPEQFATETVATYMANKQYDAFKINMSTYLKKYGEDIRTKRHSYVTWMPYVRAYAFLNQGEIAGIEPNLLRGQLDSQVPQSCAQKLWESKWQKIINNLVKDIKNWESVRKSMWGRIVFWDPYWVKRRKQYDGWLMPENYYVFCLVQSHNALVSLTKNRILQDMAVSSANKVDLNLYLPLYISKLLLHRLKQQIRVTETKAQEFVAPHEGLFKALSQDNDKELSGLKVMIDEVLGFLNCVDDGLQQQDILSCVWSGDASLKEYTNLYRLRRRVYALLESHDQLTVDQRAILLELRAKLPTVDPYSGLNYNVENTFLSSVILSEGHVKKAREELEKVYPTIDFSH